MTIALRSGFQRLRVQALVAVFLATQFWEWYPLFHVVVKAFEPTALLAVDASLRLPREVRWVCEAAPSRFEYVAMLAKEEKTAKKEEVTFSFQQPQHAPEEVKEEKEVKKEEPKKEEEIKSIRQTYRAKEEETSSVKRSAVDDLLGAREVDMSSAVGV